MARPTKQGIDYFPLDVDFFTDIKIRKISRACGVNSSSILICLLCNIYRENGYYISWDEDLPFVIADTVGVSEGAVREVIIKAIQVGFFNQDLYERFQILTSEGIQKRFKLATYQRKDVVWDPRYLVNCANNSVNCANNSINLVNNRQSKVKKIKVNNTLSKSPSLKSGDKSQSAELSAEEKERIYEIFYFDKNCKNYRDEAERFINHYSANGWLRNNGGTPIKDKIALARNWECKFEDKRVPDEFIKWLQSVYLAVKAINHEGAKAILRGIDKVHPSMCPNLHIDLYLSREAVEMINLARISPNFTLNFKVRRDK